MLTLLCIDHYKSESKTTAVLRAAKSIGLKTILIWNASWDTNILSPNDYDEKYTARSIDEIKNIANKLIASNPNIKHIMSSTEFLTPLVNDLLLNNKFKHPIAYKTEDIYLLLNKNLINTFLFGPKALPKIGSWLITKELDFDKIYQEYNGPVYVKIEWGLAGGNKLDDYDCQKFKDIYDFKRHLIDTDKIDVFLKENIEGASIEKLFHFSGITFRRVVQQYIKWESSQGPFIIFIDGKIVGVQNHYSEIPKEDSNMTLGTVIINSDVKDVSPIYSQGVDNLIASVSDKLCTSFLNAEMWEVNNTMYISDLGLRVGGANSYFATLHKNVFEHSDAMLNPIRHYLSHIFFNETDQDYSTLKYGPVARAVIRCPIKIHTKSDVEVNAHFNNVLSRIKTTKDFSIINIDKLLKALLLNKDDPNFSIDVLFFNNDKSFISLKYKELIDILNSHKYWTP